MLHRLLIFVCWCGLGFYWTLRARTAKPGAQVQGGERRRVHALVWWVASSW